MFYVGHWNGLTGKSTFQCVLKKKSPLFGSSVFTVGKPISH